MAVEIKVPALGESVTEATVEVNASVAGSIVDLAVAEGTTVQVGGVLCHIEAGAAGATAKPSVAAAAPAAAPAAPKPVPIPAAPPPAPTPAAPVVAAAPAPAGANIAASGPATRKLA